jgi:hypothetical protein
MAFGDRERRRCLRLAATEESVPIRVSSARLENEKERLRLGDRCLALEDVMSGRTAGFQLRRGIIKVLDATVSIE